MYLRDLAVGASTASAMPQGRTHLEFNVSCYTPVEAYLDLLPRRKVVLDDLAKVNVWIGKRPPKTQMYLSAGNVAVIYWPWFDFPRYFSLSRAEQQVRIAATLHKTLLRIAARTNSRRSWYVVAYSAFMAQTIPLPEISDFELR